MSKLFYIIIFLYISLPVFAQQTPLFTQYRENYSIINPAMLSSDYLLREQNLDFGVSLRTQWTNLDNHPVTQTVKGNFLFENRGVSILSGGYLINDKTGPTSFSGVYGKIGGLLSDDPYWGGISMGLTIGVQQLRVDASEFVTRQEGDILATQDQTKIAPDVGFGFYYYKRFDKGWFSDDLVYAGISVPQVLGVNISFQEGDQDFNIRRQQHVNLIAGYYKMLDNNKFIEPSVWLRYVANAPLSLDVNFRYHVNQSIFFGMGGSIGRTFHFETGFVIGQQLRIGYGFDFPFNTIGPVGRSTHEINLSFALER